MVFFNWGILKFKVLEDYKGFEKGKIVFGAFSCPRAKIDNIFEIEKHDNKTTYLLNSKGILKKKELAKKYLLEI